jgi:predicted hydrolase (HD superfamily)
VFPNSAEAARELLVGLGAPERLLRHVELVGEAGDLILKQLASLAVPVRQDFVRVGIVLHDVGKILHTAELNQPGAKHEPAGEDLLLSNGVSPEIARVCLSHARWTTMDTSLEELLIALADKLWKGVRKPELEERVIDAVALALGKTRWEVFVDLDTLFEDVATAGPERLARSAG